MFTAIALHGAVEGTARLVRMLEQSNRHSPGPETGQKPAADPAHARQPQQTDLGVSSRVEFGQVVDAIPSARCYKVQPESGGPPFDCALGIRSSNTPIGVYDADTLVVGTQVRYIRHQTGKTGLILCAEPMFDWDPRRFYGDIVSQGSNIGLHVEAGLQHPFTMGGKKGAIKWNGGITSFSGRTPFDSMEIGEFNRSAETGMMIHMDSYMACMRVDEMCGVSMFYWDSMLRIAGQNFEEWAGHSQREAYDDEGEHMYYHGIASYPWENMGQLQNPNAGSWAELGADDVQNSTPWYSRIEPANNDLQPFHRFRSYGGYLGQGQKKIMCAPDLSGSVMELLYGDGTYEPLGLHEQNITMSGHWGVRSALGLTIAKRPVMPVPKRIRAVTSASGDRPATYKASDFYGAGAAHKVKPSPDQAVAHVNDEELAWHKAACLLDLHAHLFNWEAAHPFHYHGNDYFYQEEDSYSHVANNQEEPTWTELKSASYWYMDVPAYDTVSIDHRTGMSSIKIYRNTSYITFLDEGGVCIGDGWGSEIRMAGGCINIDCAGDVFLNAGRNVISWGGRDVIMRAHESVDITTTQHDVRIKAEENIQVLAGNSSDGSKGHILIESRATGPPEYDYAGNVGEGIEANGITLKCINTEFVTWAKNIYLRTGNLPSGKDTTTVGAATIPKEGDIVFDAQGIGDVISRAEFVKHWVKCAVVHMFPSENTAATVNFFTVDGVVLANDLFVDGDIVAYGSMVAKDDFLACTGHFYSSSGGAVAQMSPDSTATVCGLPEAGHLYEDQLRTWSGEQYAIDFTQMWYAAERPGHDNIIQAAWASLRIEANYGTAAWKLYESRWAQMARLNGGPGPTAWTELDVESNDASNETYPFPGRQRLNEDTTYHWQSLALMQNIGQAADRGAVYETALHDTPTQMVPNGNFPAIKK